MNVGELKESLKEFPDDLEILTSADDEGNGYRPLYYYPSVYYIEKNEDKHGFVESIRSSEDLKDPADEDFDEWEHSDINNYEPRLVIG